MITSITGNGGMRLELTNDLSELGAMAEAVEGLCERMGVDEGVVTAINLALEEIVTNVISYAYHDGGDHRILIDVTLMDGVFTARIEDDGVPYDPLARDPPELDVPLEERRIGGLGVHLVKNLMDDVTYVRQHDRNVLTMRKSTSPGGADAG